MYATCAITACKTPVTQCHDHHIHYREQGGRTDITNLLPVCEHHRCWIHSAIIGAAVVPPVIEFKHELRNVSIGGKAAVAA